MNETPPDSPSFDGISWVDLHHLTPSNRHIINWIRRQKNCSLLDLAIHLCQDEETAFKIVLPLIEQGFIQETFKDGEPFYQIKTPPRKGQGLFKKLQEKRKVSENNSESSENK